MENEIIKEENTDIKSEVSVSSKNIPQNIQELLTAGVHFGHIKSTTHPKMLPYIFGTRNKIHIINVNSTIEKLDLALKYLKQCKKENKKVLFVGTKFYVRELVKQIAEDLEMPYITTYWPGGLLTNWETVKNGIQRLKDLEQLSKSEDWNKYTKQERAIMTRELEKLKERWSGIQGMESLPDAVIIVDMKEDKVAATEAMKKGIPVIALADTNIDPKGIDYMIPANDDSLASIELILSKIKESLK